VCIEDEIITYTTLTGDVISGCTRGAFGTVAAAHKDEDLVQQVLIYTSQRAHNVVKDLLLNYAGVPASSVVTSEWDAAATLITELYTTQIAKPEPVGDLIAELSEQVGFTVYHDVETNKINFVGLRAAAPVFTVDDDRIVRGSLNMRRLDSKRISQVLLHYGRRSPVGSLDDRQNYRSRFRTVDAGAESTFEYGVPSIHEVFSRWIPVQARTLAENSANRLLQMFRDAPLEAEFRERENRLGDYSLARVFTLQAREVEDFYGRPQQQTHVVTKITRGPAEGSIKSQQIKIANVGTINADKTVFVEDNTLDFVFRDAWEAVFGPPVAGDVPKCVIISTAIAGASSRFSYGFDTGNWPAGIVPANHDRGPYPRRRRDTWRRRRRGARARRRQSDAKRARRPQRRPGA
jgi:hypothetical protein